MSDAFQSQRNDGQSFDVNTPTQQVPPAVAKNHHVHRYNASSDTDADSTVNSIGWNVVESKKNQNFGENRVGKRNQIGAARAPADAGVSQTSDDETDYTPCTAYANVPKKRGFLDDDDDDLAVTSTPNGQAQHVRSTTHRHSQMQTANGTEMIHRRRTIPTAHQLFDYSQTHSEFRSSPFSRFGGAVDNGGDEGKPRRYPYRRRSAPVQQPPVIPENFETCPQCLSIMHKDYMRAHIQRKHRVNDLTIDAESNESGNTFNPMAPISNGYNQATFIRCKLCLAHMNTNYLPMHLARGHRAEFDGSVGFIWTQCGDNHVNQLLSSNRVYVKNGAFYFKDME